MVQLKELVISIHEPVDLRLARNHIQPRLLWFYLLKVKLGFCHSRRHANPQTEYGTRAYHSSV